MKPYRIALFLAVIILACVLFAQPIQPIFMYFTDLMDTPADYSDDGGKIVVVNSTPDALEFTNSPTVTNLTASGYLDMAEIAQPGTDPAANNLRLYVEDVNGFSFLKYLDSGGMKREFMRDSMLLAYNNSGSTIAAARIVYADASTGTVPEIKLAKADSINTMPAIGVTIESIANGAYGRVMQIGILENVNTSALSAGDVLYVSAATAGVPVTTAPVTPNLTQEIGTVLVDNATTGAIQIVARGLTGDEYGTAQNSFIIGDGLSSAKSLQFNAANDVTVGWDDSTNTLSLQPAVDSTTFFQVKNAVGDVNIVNVDSTNERVGIETATPTHTLTVSGDVDIQHTSTEADDHAFEIDIDAAGYGDVKAITIDYITGAISTGEDEGVILVNVDELDSTGGDVFGLEVLATEGSAGVYGMKTGVGIGPVHQDSGTFANPTTGTDNTASTDVPAMIDGNDATTTAIFENNNEYIIIGAAAAFEELEIVLTTDASVSIKPTFGYSTAGSGQFTTFSPVDGTNGFRNTGIVAWDASDLTGHTTNDDTGTYDIKVTRTRNTMVTTPVLGYAKTAATTEYIWDENGDLSIRGLTVTGSSVLGLNSAVFQPTTDAGSFFQVSDADGGNPVLDVNTIDERVGIGTASPAMPLHIINSAGHQIRIGYNTTKYAQFRVHDDGKLEIDGLQGETITTRAGRDIIYSLGSGGKMQFKIGADVIMSISAVNDTVNIGPANPSQSYSALEIEHPQSYMTLTNNTHEDTDGGREGRLIFRGQQSGGEETTLARIEASHDGAADDEKGQIKGYINDGDDGDSPTQVYEWDSTGLEFVNSTIIYDVNNVSADLTSFETYGLHIIDSSGAGITGILAAGTKTGQSVKFVCKVAGNDIDITVSNHVTSDPEVIRLDTAKEWVELVWDGTDWVEVDGNGQSYP